VARETLGEGLVLQRRARLHSADAPVGLGGHAERGAGEVMVRGVGVRAVQAPQPSRGVSLPGGEQRRRQLSGLRGVELDVARDDRGPERQMRELVCQPVGRGPRIGVGGRDQTPGPPELEQPRAREIHARPPGATATTIRALDHRHRQARRGGRDGGRLVGVILATVQDDDHLKGIDTDGLRAQRQQARSDSLLLVASRYDDHGR
jgi:hypothetical protein